MAVANQSLNATAAATRDGRDRDDGRHAEEQFPGELHYVTLVLREIGEEQNGLWATKRPQAGGDRNRPPDGDPSAG